MGEAVVVIGVGNTDRGDDGVGHQVVSHLEGGVAPGVRLVTATGADPATLIEAWRDADTVILIDAMVSDARPGTVERFDVAAGPLPESVHLVSTHALGATAAIEMARALGRLPSRFAVYGVEGSDFGFGDGLGPAAAAAATIATEMILEELAES